MYESCKIRIYPNKDQKKQLEKFFGSVRWVYNKMIEINQKKYHRTGKGLSGYDMASLLPKIKKQHKWLEESPSKSLQISCFNLADAYNRFFKGQNKFPNFKSKYTKQAVCSNQNISIETDKIKFPKLEPVKFRYGELPEGKLKKITISKSTSGKYFASLLFETEKETEKKKKIDNVLGIDLGLESLIICSNGFKVKPPKALRKREQKLKKQQRDLARKKKGSNRYKKQKQRLAITHEKIANIRKDFNHKLSKKLVNSENQAIALESLNIANMLKNHHLAKSIGDAGWYQLITFLTYKAERAGKHILKVGTFYPSSKTCSSCGIVKNTLVLSDRIFNCNSCDFSIDRDINAAINIANEAVRNTVSGRGGDVRPEYLGKMAVAYEALN